MIKFWGRSKHPGVVLRAIKGQKYVICMGDTPILQRIDLKFGTYYFFGEKIGWPKFHSGWSVNRGTSHTNLFFVWKSINLYGRYPDSHTINCLKKIKEFKKLWKTIAIDFVSTQSMFVWLDLIRNVNGMQTFAWLDTKKYHVENKIKYNIALESAIDKCNLAIIWNFLRPSQI